MMMTTMMIDCFKTKMGVLVMLRTVMKMEMNMKTESNSNKTANSISNDASTV